MSLRSPACRSLSRAAAGFSQPLGAAQQLHPRERQPGGTRSRRDGGFILPQEPSAASSGAFLVPKVIFRSHTSLRKISRGRCQVLSAENLGFVEGRHRLSA